MITAARASITRVLPGVGVAFSVAAIAHGASSIVPTVPDVVLALAIGIVVGNLGARSATAAGARFVLRFGLRGAIIALGAGLDLTVIASSGWTTFTVIVLLVAIAMTLGVLMGQLASLERTVAVLLGVGTAICGASAILAVSPLLRARERETAYAVTTIFAFNLAALLCLPWVGHQLELSQVRFGTWVGTAVNDTSVVVATGYVYGATAAGVATLVKLTRTALLVPLCVVVGLAFGPDGSRGSVFLRARQSIPWFVLGFFALSFLNTSHVVPGGWMPLVAHAGSLGLVIVLAAVGLNVDIEGLWRLGLKPLLIGFALAATMVVISFALLTATAIG